MTFTPTFNRILIKVPPVSETRNVGGIEIPDTVSSLNKPQKCRTGVVIAAGVPEKAAVSAVTMGQTVIIGQFGGVEVELEKEKYLVVTYEDLLLTEAK